MYACVCQQGNLLQALRCVQPQVGHHEHHAVMEHVQERQRLGPARSSITASLGMHCLAFSPVSVLVNERSVLLQLHALESLGPYPPKQLLMSSSCPHTACMRMNGRR